jgi:hypothetical protein
VSVGATSIFAASPEEMAVWVIEKSDAQSGHSNFNAGAIVYVRARQISLVGDEATDPLYAALRTRTDETKRMGMEPQRSTERKIVCALVPSVSIASALCAQGSETRILGPWNLIRLNRACH